MTKKMRKIIRIDEKRCNGCGLCLPGCPEGALQVVDGKVRLVKESFCDGLGACLGHCPEGALLIEERDAEEYDAQGVLIHLEKKSPELAEKHREHLRAHGLEEAEQGKTGTAVGCPSKQVHHSTDRQWPVKLYLIPPSAQFLKNSDLILVADCVPFAYANLHNDFLQGKAIAAGCPKFDDITAYEEKIEQILESVNINSLTVLYMEISCCSGFVSIITEALKKSGSDVPLETIQIGINGEVINREIIA